MSDTREGAFDWSRHFEDNAEPRQWFNTAEMLRAASNRLWNDWQTANAELFCLIRAGASADDLPAETWERGRFGLPALLLSGYAIENLLKAIRVKQWRKSGLAPVADGRLDGYFKTHDLVRFADDVGLPLSDRDRQFLVRLEACVVWAGKYPIAKEAEPKELTKYGLGPFRVVTSDDQALITSVYERLVRIYTVL
jgi:hypothetical protein